MPKAAHQMRPCLDCGAPSNGPRCPVHQAQQRAKYGHAHQLERAQWAPLVAAGGLTCPLCGGRIEPGTSWDLGHVPPPTRPQHARCNRSAAALGLG